ncbi:type VII secretion protein EccE [Actinoplanes sp. RD1]|uniref:type VII secretion protein EccE n=1 Tax=Actinoplanes sp. RD1 TaxID=3064538 RepID=UPI00274292DB|nr:type VII secretion protein EccE [Actinoplanes sp. RD1]
MTDPYGRALPYGQPAAQPQPAQGQAAPQPVLPAYAGQARPAAAQAQARAQTVTAARPAAQPQADYDFRPGAAPAEPPPPAVVTRPGHPRLVKTGLGALSLGQLLAWQLAAAAVLAAYTLGNLVTTIAVAVVALLLVSPTLIRFRGRWLYRWFGVWLRFRGRSHRAPASGEGAALDLLGFAEPTVALDSVELDDRQVALITHRGGLCAVLELGPEDTVLFAGEPVRLPSPVAMLPLAEAHAFPITAQLLVSVTPAPVVGPGVVERSYRELTGSEVPAERRSWLVLQAARTADAYADAELRPALLSAVKRARRHLRMDKVSARILDREGLLGAVSHLGRLSAGKRPDPEARPTGRETWRAAWVEEFVHSCRRVVHWPVRDWQPEEILLKLPAVGSVLSLAVTHNPARVAEDEAILVEVAFRLAAPDPGVLAAGDKALDDAVQAAGGRTERYDGEQVLGLAATLPLGGFL